MARPQYDALLDSCTDRHTGRYVEQVWWYWHGPLDTQRFTAAWQSVADREVILRAAFEREPQPRVVFHNEVRAEVVRHPAGTVDRDELLARDRLRGFDLGRPGPLRVTLVDVGEDARPAAPRGAAEVTWVLLTFHHGLLDARSVFVLLDEFSRAYLEGGVLPGGERRPDLRDWAHWLEHQDTAPAQDFFNRIAPDGPPVVQPALPGPRTRQSGCGRADTRLVASEADRLHRWAAAWGLPDSSALHAVWALLLYRAADATGPAPVGFGVTVSGRGIALDAVDRLVGPLRSCLPMTVRVDPAQPVIRLLETLRDQALDLAAYEWVCMEQVHEWTGPPAPGRLLDSLVSVETTSRPLADLRARLADAGVRFGEQYASGAHSLLLAALLARPATDGSLTLSAVHDRARLSDADAGILVDQCARLLRHLPSIGETETVTEVLTVLGGDEPPRAAPPQHGTGS
ncbi:condensation domain-containing protein [Streptomyces sp. KMM 9044]|uniref:condensation domain-containing protein n=1 Tax=Streptomyces sp. KMM 9044 TaxID=2744474 RepID=UPI002150728F|nr:condensation domain-containing protein [Streptomyces sp. KMM 9044]WAX82216.1 condensation domain-containing protein [Streptomyces sp. KMM 9044]